MLFFLNYVEHVRICENKLVLELIQFFQCIEGLLVYSEENSHCQTLNKLQNHKITIGCIENSHSKLNISVIRMLNFQSKISVQELQPFKENT